jgi:fatty-acid desaturase
MPNLNAGSQHLLEEQSFAVDYLTVAWLVTVHILAGLALFHFSWTNLFSFFGTYVVVAGWGIGISYHRMLSHRALKMPKLWERIFATFGVLNLQGSPLRWVATHRKHHAFADTENDPHNSRRGFWYSHIGWIVQKKSAFRDADEMRKFARDIAQDPYYRWLESVWNQVLLQLLLVLTLWLALGFWAMMWGVFVRVTFIYHSTWLINSATHRWGYQNFPDSQDSSRNNWWAALLSLGEGWHNNHHRYQHLANMGHRWWELDPMMMTIRVLRWMRIASDVNDESFA